MTNRTEIGNAGELLAQEFLGASGFDILETNVRSRHGEIDIIARKNDTYHFVEVKTRSGTAFGLPVESVTERKYSSLVQLAENYCADKQLRDTAWQIDAVGIILNTDGTIADISYYPNISYL